MVILKQYNPLTFRAWNKKLGEWNRSFITFELKQKPRSTTLNPRLDVTASPPNRAQPCCLLLKALTEGCGGEIQEHKMPPTGQLWRPKRAAQRRPERTAVGATWDGGGDRRERRGGGRREGRGCWLGQRQGWGGGHGEAAAFFFWCAQGLGLWEDRVWVLRWPSSVFWGKKFILGFFLAPMPIHGGL
jgi:hypothetical protein